MLQWIEVLVHTQPGKAELNAQILERKHLRVLAGKKRVKSSACTMQKAAYSRNAN